MEAKKRSRVLAVLFIGVLMGALDIAIVGPALPAIKGQFVNVDERSLAWMFSVYVLFNLIGTPLMAKLSDLNGRKMIYILDVSLFALGSLIVALSSSFTMVLVGRAVQGFGAGGIFPVASAVIGDTFPPEKRGGALGLIGAVFGLAFMVGPILGGVILSLASWHWLFLINLPIAILVIVMAFVTLPATRQSSVSAFDWLGMMVLSIMLASLAYGLNQIDTNQFFGSLVSLQVLPFLMVSVISGILLRFVEQKAANPILPPKLFEARQLKLGYVLSAGAGLGEASLVFMPLLAVAALSNVSTSQASYLLMPVVLAMAFGSPLTGRLLDRLGSKVVIVSGTLIMTIGVFLLSRFPGVLGMFIFSGALIGLGLSALLGAPIRYITLNEVAASERSVAQGVITVFSSVGQLFGSAVVGSVAASQGGGVSGYSAAFLAISVIGALMMVLAVGLKNRKDEMETARRQVELDTASL